MAANTTQKVPPVKPGYRPGKNLAKGDEQRRLEYAEYCFQKTTLGYSLREIAEMMAADYMLATVPCHLTVRAYVGEAVKYRSENITIMRENYLAVALPRLEAMVRNFLPIATNTDPGRPLRVLRRERFKGELIEVIDEDAFKEQREAAEVLLKITEQARKLLGIGLKVDGGDGQPVTAQQINTLIINAVQQNFTGQGAPSNIGALELTSGDAAIDAMEGGL